MIPNERAYLMWRYCKDPNDIDKAIAAHDEDWAGLESLHQIISITYDPNHGSYVVFWRAYCANKLLKLIPPEEMCSRFAVMNAPAVDPQQWIPCEERLPEVGTYVLVSKKPLNFRSNLPNVCTAHRSRDPRSGKEEWNDMLFGKLDDDDVLAWMPLPESYAERRTE